MPAEKKEKRGLSHDELRLAKSRRSLEDLNRLIEFAEETIGTPPLRTREIDEEGNTIVEAEAAEGLEK